VDRLVDSLAIFYILPTTDIQIYIKNIVTVFFKPMDFFDNPNDSVVVKRANELDLSVKKNREEEYSQWTSFKDHKKKQFALADFVYANVKDALPDLQDNTLEILWIACCSDHEMYEQILQYSNSFLERRYPKHINLLRVDLAQFLQEVAETLQTEMGDEAQEQKIQFKEYLTFNDENIVLPGEEILQEFRKKIHVLYYLPPNNVAIPYFLQVQVNFDDLSQHSIIRHVCRSIRNIDTEPPNVYDWIKVIEYVRHIGIKAYSLHGNLNTMNSKSIWPKFLTVFEEQFPDKSVPIEERFLQLMTIYHPRWPHIFTLSGWRMNRQETALILDFLHNFPKVFYRSHFITELFHLIV